MKCEDAAEFVSALYDGERIPKEAAEHLGGCAVCRERLSAYSAVGAELRRVASLDEGAELRAGGWQNEQRAASKWWHKGKEPMRVPRFAFALMLVAILLLSGGLVMVRARAGAAGPILRLMAKYPPKGKTFECYLATNGEPGTDFCDYFSNLGHKAILSIGVRFLHRDGERVELGVKTRYDNPYPEWMTGRPSDERLTDVAEESVWIEPGEKHDVTVAGLGILEMAGDFIGHKPPFSFSPEDTIDPKVSEFRMTGPVLIRGKEVVLNMGGASGGFEDKPGMGDAIYLPGEGRFLFSLRPFKGAVQGDVFGNQTEFHLEGQTYLLLTGVPPTGAEHVWVKHEPDYKPSQHEPNMRDDHSLLGGASPSDFPPE
jgi:hypothetical protein